MLSRIITRSLFTTSNFRCTSKSNNDKAADSESRTETNKSRIKELVGKVSAFCETKPEWKWTTRPYMQDQRGRPQQVPDERSVVLFPGQGSQYVGMAQNLTKYPKAMDLFGAASEILGYDLLKLCLEGPKEKLDQTIYCQPAVMVTSLAALEQLKDERPNAIESCVATAGFSLGEITSLVFAGSIIFDRAVRLVQIRAEAMQMACDQFDGGMATVLLQQDCEIEYPLKIAKQWCVERGVKNPECVVANDLFPNCKVIAGSKEALQFIENNLKKLKLARIKRIAVNGAFHTIHMKPVVEPFAQALRQIRVVDPIIGVYSNVEGKRYFDTKHIRRQLPQQIVSPVNWEQTMHLFYNLKKFENTFICGPGDALRTILKKVNASACDKAYMYGD